MTHSSPSPTPHVVVIGAGVGGLTAGALLLHAGFRVTVLEAHVYPGGSAGTFYHKGYRFDAGATLAGGFAPGGPHARVAEVLGLTWPVHPVDPAWVVHLPDGQTVTQWADAGDWRRERQAAFPGTESFWETQEMLAGLSWDISARPFPWPPESARDLWTLATSLRPRTLRALPTLTRTVADLLPDYPAGAQDLPRRPTPHRRPDHRRARQRPLRQRGPGPAPARRQPRARRHRRHRPHPGRLDRGQRRPGPVPAAGDGHRRPRRARRGRAHQQRPDAGTGLAPGQPHPLGAAGLAGRRRAALVAQRSTAPRCHLGRIHPLSGVGCGQTLTDTLSTHHQVIVDADKPLGEGNSVFISLSAAGDPDRAPAGKRAATLSTHTAIAPWWALRQGDDEAAYRARRRQYTDRMLDAATRALPRIRDAAELILPGTPVTFEFYTRRPQGMVGGFPQTSIFAARGPGTGLPNVRLVGDSIFPGQSTAGVTLGAMRVARSVIHATERRLFPASTPMAPQTNPS